MFCAAIAGASNTVARPASKEIRARMMHTFASNAGRSTSWRANCSDTTILHGGGLLQSVIATEGVFHGSANQQPSPSNDPAIDKRHRAPSDSGTRPVRSQQHDAGQSDRTPRIRASARACQSRLSAVLHRTAPVRETVKNQSYSASSRPGSMLRPDAAKP